MTSFHPSHCTTTAPFFKILISTHNQFPPSLIKIASFLIFLFLFILYQSFSLTSHLKVNNQEEKLQTLKEKTMKVHPLPNKRNNITFLYYNNSNSNNPNGNLSGPSSGGSHKKLRRLPHIFSRVLELPFRSDAEVSVEEGPDCFRFVAETEIVAGGVRAHMVEIYPGLTKIVVRPNGYLGFSSLDELELDLWRFRLPESTQPELASAFFVDGELVVTVPKRKGVEEEGDENDGGEFIGGMGNNNNNNSARLVLVQ